MPANLVHADTLYKVVRHSDSPPPTARLGVWPGVHIPFLSSLAATPARYAALTMLHGSLMVFFVLTTAPQAGFGNYFLPLQIGARDMAFPALNVFSFWATAFSLAGVTLSFFISPGSGLTLWTAGVALFCLAGLLTSINFTATALDLRTTGLTLPGCRSRFGPGSSTPSSVC